MVIIQSIRQSDNEGEIYALLTAYLEALRESMQPPDLVAYVLELPIAGFDAVCAQLSAFLSALQLASRRLDDRARVMVKEALYVFGAALEHLQGLHVRRSAQPRPQGDVRAPSSMEVHPLAAAVPSLVFARDPARARTSWTNVLREQSFGVLPPTI